MLFYFLAFLDFLAFLYFLAFLDFLAFLAFLAFLDFLAFLVIVLYNFMPPVAVSPLSKFAYAPSGSRALLASGAKTWPCSPLPNGR